MPKETFFNLPEEKRALISSVAIDEFANYSFDAASINRIVTSAGIAKGSFYQYFEDKRDLFLYIVDLVAEEKAKYVSPAMENPAELDFFTLLRELYITGIRFSEEHPQYAKIGHELFRQKSDPVHKEVFESSMPVALSFFETILKNAIARAEIRADIDIKMLAFMIASMNALVVEYYVAETEKNLGPEMMASIDEFIDFLRKGIGISQEEAPVIETPLEAA